MPARTQQRESPKPERMASFAAIVKQAAEPAADGPWWFVVLPRDVSERLPRRGRTSVQGRINGAPFLVTLEPDGKLSHWLKIDKALLKAARATAGSEALDPDLVRAQVVAVLDDLPVAATKLGMLSNAAVAANTDDISLANTASRQTRRRFIGECPAATDDTEITWCAHSSRDNAEFCQARQ